MLLLEGENLKAVAGLQRRVVAAAAAAAAAAVRGHGDSVAKCNTLDQQH